MSSPRCRIVGLVDEVDVLAGCGTLECCAPDDIVGVDVDADANAE
jgi:hypothetical protein